MMDTARRSLCLTLPALCSALAWSQNGPSIPSLVEPFDSLPVKQNGANSARAILDGETHAGVHLEVHETVLGAGNSPHPPHSHQHEELFLILRGQLEVTIAGKTTMIGPGSAAFVHSGELHGVRNPGHNEAQYFVVAVDKET
jgi:quercetin dioxygenase-like cupin family protein